MKEIIFGTKSEIATVYLERGNVDGGLVVCCMVPEDDGTFTAHRHWFSDPAQARTSYAVIDAAEIETRLSAQRAGVIRG